MHNEWFVQVSVLTSNVWWCKRTTDIFVCTVINRTQFGLSYWWELVHGYIWKSKASGLLFDSFNLLHKCKNILVFWRTFIWYWLSNCGIMCPNLLFKSKNLWNINCQNVIGLLTDLILLNVLESTLENMLVSGLESIWNATAQWWFSSGEMSLYRIARSVLALIWYLKAMRGKHRLLRLFISVTPFIN